MGIAYYLHCILNWLTCAIKIGLMVSNAQINFINFSDSFPSSFLVNTRHSLFKPKRKVFFLVKPMLYNPLRTQVFGWVVLNIWVRRPVCLGEFTKKLGELSRKLGELSKKILGELVFGWVVLHPNLTTCYLQCSHVFIFFLIWWYKFIELII